MNEGKGNKGLKIAVVILIILLLALASYVAYDKLFYRYLTNVTPNEEKKANDQEKKESKVVESLDVLSDVVQNNFNKLMHAANYFCGTQGEYFKDLKLTTKDIDNTLVYATVSNAFFDNKNNVSEDEMNEVIKEYFGPDYKFEHQEYTSKICTNHHYNSSTRTYEYVEPACGGVCGPYNIQYKISKAELNGDDIILNVKVLFPGDDKDLDSNNHVKYYSDYKLTKNVSNLDYEWYQPDNNPPVYSDSNLAKGGNYKFVMRKYKDDIYYFVSSEPID